MTEALLTRSPTKATIRIAEANVATTASVKSRCRPGLIVEGLADRKSAMAS